MLLTLFKKSNRLTRLVILFLKHFGMGQSHNDIFTVFTFEKKYNIEYLIKKMKCYTFKNNNKNPPTCHFVFYKKRELHKMHIILFKKCITVLCENHRIPYKKHTVNQCKKHCSFFFRVVIVRCV